MAWRSQNNAFYMVLLPCEIQNLEFPYRKKKGFQLLQPLGRIHNHFTIFTIISQPYCPKPLFPPLGLPPNEAKSSKTHVTGVKTIHLPRFCGFVKAKAVQFTMFCGPDSARTMHFTSFHRLLKAKTVYFAMFLCFDRAKTMFFTRFCGSDNAKTLDFPMFLCFVKPKNHVYYRFCGCVRPKPGFN